MPRCHDLKIKRKTPRPAVQAYGEEIFNTEHQPYLGHLHMLANNRNSRQVLYSQLYKKNRNKGEATLRLKDTSK